MSDKSGEQLTMLPYEQYNYVMDATIAERLSLEREERGEPAFENGMKLYQLRMKRVQARAGRILGLEADTYSRAIDGQLEIPV